MAGRGYLRRRGKRYQLVALAATGTRVGTPGRTVFTSATRWSSVVANVIVTLSIPAPPAVLTRRWVRTTNRPFPHVKCPAQLLKTRVNSRLVPCQTATSRRLLRGKDKLTRVARAQPLLDPNSSSVKEGRSRDPGDSPRSLYAPSKELQSCVVGTEMGTHDSG